jgi:hypothetical protein
MTPLFSSRSRASSTVVAILGMHRSGTSWFAGALQQAGLALGEVNTEAPRNARGTRESLRLNKIHDEVLEANGGSWRRPPATTKWPREQRIELGRYIEEMDGASAMWGFKDPRALLLFDEWERRAPSLVCVGIYRHPIAVYRSLADRSPDFTEDEALALWRTYNERLLARHRREAFPILRFDVSSEELQRNLRAVAETLGLGKTGDDFFESSLAHHAPADETVPESVREIWKELEELRAR